MWVCKINNKVFLINVSLKNKVVVQLWTFLELSLLCSCTYFLALYPKISLPLWKTVRLGQNFSKNTYLFLRSIGQNLRLPTAQCADCALKHAKVHFCEIGLFLLVFLKMQGPCFNLIRITNKKNSFIKGGIQV